MREKLTYLSAILATLTLAGAFVLSPTTGAVQDSGKECRRCCDEVAKQCERDLGPGNQAPCRGEKEECLRGCAESSPTGLPPSCSRNGVE